VLSRYDPRAASELLARASELDPGWGQPHQLRGNTLYYLEDYVGAERELRRALQLDARDFDAQNSLALTLQALECFDDARDAYQRALRLRPGMWQAWANLGLMELEHGSATDAETALRNALEQASRETPLRLALAQVLEKRGATREALAESEIGIGFDAHNAELWELVSRLHATLGNPERALDAALLGLEIDPKNAALAKDRDGARAALARPHAAR
jgi:tetratricopeptide (TPR) repeat protein